MVIVYENTPQRMYMDGFLKKNLDTAKEIIKNDWDMIFAFDGAEGSGKSTLAVQCAYYCDPTMTLDNVVFNARDFRKAIINAKPFQAIVYDEAYSGLNSRSAMSFINKSLVGMLTEIRQKNLFVFIVLPCFFDLDKYVALWRSRVLIHVYTGEGFQRGRFSFFNVDRKKDLYMKGKKFYEYKLVQPNFRGAFTNAFPLDLKEYKEKKWTALKAREDKSIEAEYENLVQELLEERVFALGEIVSHKIKALILGMSDRTYYNHLKKWKEKEALES